MCACKCVQVYKHARVCPCVSVYRYGVIHWSAAPRFTFALLLIMLPPPPPPSPQLDINTVAAGGGSMLFFRSGLFVVGPESAGADPGPACYSKGGPRDSNTACVYYT